MSGSRCVAILQYDGTNFHGWQRQAAERSVQGEVEAALERLFQRPTPVHAAGRTDAGVHALGQATSFDAPGGWSPSDLTRALNALLPGDLWVQHVREVWPEFHARRSALTRRYRYVIGTDAASRAPFRHPFEWALAKPLDVARLHAAARTIVGDHEFAAYAARGTPQSHYRCSVQAADWRERPDGRGVTFEIEANRFLHHMVRFLVGTMIDVALGRRPESDIHELLDSEDNQAASPPAPPQGLYLLTVRYPDHPPA